MATTTSTSPLSELLGPNLITKEGERSTDETLTGKNAIGLYFSAHWCPPCRGFTPKLAEWYTNAYKAKGLEIVFVSSDRDQAGFDSYFEDMPWTALPFSDRDRKNTLSKKFKVQGIPTFVIIGADGSVINTEGREAVQKDPTGEKYPWKPPSAAEKAALVLDALGPELVTQTGGKPIGLYFSAHWCPPCRGFTPKLANWYDAGLKDKMEIIFCSSDQDQNTFDSYFAEMPWLALPFEKRAEKEALSDICGVNGIPSLTILNTDGTIVTTDGRSKVSSDPTGAAFPQGWLPQPFNNVNESTNGLNEESCLIAMGNDSSMIEDIKGVAEEYHAASGGDVETMPYRFFHAPEGSVTDQIRKLTKVSGNSLILLDIPDGGKFYVAPSPSVRARSFLSDIKSGLISSQSFS